MPVVAFTVLSEVDPAFKSTHQYSILPSSNKKLNNEKLAFNRFHMVFSWLILPSPFHGCVVCVLFPFCERLSELWSLCASGGLQASSAAAAVVVWRDCAAVSPTHRTQTHTHKHTASRSVLSVSLSVSVSLSATHMRWVSTPTHSLPPLSPGAPLSLFPLSLFPHKFSTSSLSSLTSSCVIQLRNISSSRRAINIFCPPKTVRIIIFLIITAVFL